MDRIYRTVNIKNQETQHYYSHLIQHDARQRCPALIVLKEEHNNNNPVKCQLHKARYIRWKWLLGVL